MGWGGEDKRLSEPDQDLARHGQREGGWGRARAAVAEPVADEDEDRGRDDCGSWTTDVEGVEGERGRYEEGEQERSAQPIDDTRGCGEVGRCRVGDSGEG